MLKDAIQRIKDVAEALPDDDPDKLDMLNIEGDYSKLMEWALVKRREHLENAKAVKALTKRYTERSKSLENKAEGLKGVIRWMMESAKKDSFKCAYGSVSFRNVPPKAIVTDESKLPDEYFKKTVDKSAINAALAEGKSIDGVSMDNGSISLTIR